ncbi:O-methyltransferase [Corynebacterium pacaense]|uniref:O-methyltransferase n=1 Tax=Corynebacterium pacaense TaxID=1816684 RepID=UPI0009BBD562|nr:class I SAM-dependent methyltransferase [Corynebacterium pacaense]
MDTNLLQSLAELYQEGRQFDATQESRVDRRRNLEPESAAILHTLVVGIAPDRLLEIGTSNGYSTIWLADALGSTRGRMTTIDNDRQRSAEAEFNLEECGLRDRVEVLVGDAGELLKTEADGAWPFIFLDAERSFYADYWPELRRVLAHSGLLIVDNVISHADQVTEFRALVDADPGFSAVVIRSGAGLLVVQRGEGRR